MGATAGRDIGSISAMSGRPQAVTAIDLVRTFQPRKRPAVQALDGVRLEVDEGEVHGLLGPNGAGKTTLVKILTTVLLPTSGRAQIFGHDVVRDAKAVRPLIGIVFGGERGLYTRLTARQNLEYWASLYRLPGPQIKPRAAALLDRVGLADKADVKVETYSRGMKQRLHLARGLVAGAKVLFLDEPTTGMDPIAAREFRTLIAEIRAEGATILLATHDMVEAEVLCDRVTLIDHGRILATESPRSLGRLVSRFQRVDVDGADRELLDRVTALPGVESIAETADGHRINVDGDEHVPVVLKVIVEAGLIDVRTSRPSLEEVYVGLIGDRGLEV
jgi:ABC-2 type transport system ATP-binding protein